MNVHTHNFECCELTTVVTEVTEEVAVGHLEEQMSLTMQEYCRSEGLKTGVI